MPALSLLVAVSSLVIGCFKQPLPLAPKAAISIDRTAAATGSRTRETVVVTLISDSDAGPLASTYGATLVTDSWRVAGLKPGIGKTTDDLIAALATDPRVLSVEKDAPVEPAETRQKSWAFDDGWGSPDACEYQPATYSIDLGPALLKSRGAGVLVAILDTGAELTHPWLKGRVAGGWDFVDNDADPSDVPDGIDNDLDGLIDEGWGHGTHVAGIVGVGAPDARLEIVRVLDSDGRGDMMSVAQAIRWSVGNGAKVVNMSFGSPTRSDAVKLALEDAAAAGVVCVAAAGNSGTLDSVEFPANYRQVVAVAAIDCSDKLATFSSYGSQIGICAPGVAIRSSYRNGSYALWSGTSMAAPWVTAAAALIKSKNPSWTRAQVVERMEVTARSIWKSNQALRCYLGAGALDVGAALADSVTGRSALQ